MGADMEKLLLKLSQKKFLLSKKIKAFSSTAFYTFIDMNKTFTNLTDLQ